MRRPVPVPLFAQTGKKPWERFYQYLSAGNRGKLVPH